MDCDGEQLCFASIPQSTAAMEQMHCFLPVLGALNLAWLHFPMVLCKLAGKKMFEFCSREEFWARCCLCVSPQ